MGIKLDDIRGLVTVVRINGLTRTQDGAYIKTFSRSEEVYPLQLVVEDVENKDERYLERPPLPIDKEFPSGSRVIFLGDYAYGTEASVDGYSSATRLKLTVNKKSTKSEPNIGKIRAEMDKKLVKYLPGYVVAKQLNVTPMFLAKITSKFVMDVGNKLTNVGLMVKSPSRHEKVLGYARKTGIVWEYSNLTVRLIQEYRNKFPEFFEGLSKLSSQFPTFEDILPNKSPEEAKATTQAVLAFIKKARETFIVVSLESDSLTKASIHAVETDIIKYASLKDNPERRQLAKVPCEAVLDPRKSFALLGKQRFHLGDRVTYVQDSGNVPLFAKGTVVGYTTVGTRLSVQVIFDNEFIAGTTFGGRLKTKRGLGLDASFLLNITKRRFVYHSKASKDKKRGPNDSQRRSKDSLRKNFAEVKKQQAHEMLDVIQKNDNTNKTLQESGEPDADRSSGSGRSADVQLPLHSVGAKVANNIYNAVVRQLNKEPYQPIPFPVAHESLQGCPPPQGMFPMPPNFMPHPANAHLLHLPHHQMGPAFPQGMVQNIPMNPTTFAQNSATKSNPVNQQATQELKELIKPDETTDNPRPHGKKRSSGSLGNGSRGSGSRGSGFRGSGSRRSGSRGSGSRDNGFRDRRGRRRSFSEDK